MKRSARILLAVLGMAHLLTAITLLPAAVFFGLVALPVLVPGPIWLAVLGVRLFRPNTGVRGALRVTHCVLAPLAGLFILYGFYCLRAAQHSAEGGGGLLGAFGLIPIVMGALAGSLSVVSLCVAFSKALPGTTEAGQSVAADTGKAADGSTGAPQG